MAVVVFVGCVIVWCGWIVWCVVLWIYAKPVRVIVIALVVYVGSVIAALVI